MQMVDTPENRDDRKEQAGSDAPPEQRKLPNRKERRMIAKRRGVFKHPGAWPYVNQRSAERTNKTIRRSDSEN